MRVRGKMATSIQQAEHSSQRRRILKTAGLILPAFALPPTAVFARSERRQLGFYHTHTREKLDIVYFEDDAYSPDALEEIGHLLRDFRSRDTHPIDPKLLDILHAIQVTTRSEGQFQIISGYRSPETNAMLRNSTDGVARKSLHMKGRAIDVRLTDVSLKTLRQAGLDLRLGGVGYYPNSNFVHLDTGRIRSW
jgi:uncharacterized protein YcbK (DUF882 family)